MTTRRHTTFLEGRLLRWLLVLLACQPKEDSLPEGPTKFIDLVTPLAWQPVPAARDPLAHERPAEVECPLGIGYRHEDNGFDIQTGPCNYGMFSQRTLAPVLRGAKLKLLIYHFDLVAREPAQAHAAVLLGEHVLWERMVDIPGKANAYNIEFVSDFSAPADTPIFFHVHNHGQNSWTFGSAEVQVPR